MSVWTWKTWLCVKRDAEDARIIKVIIRVHFLGVRPNYACPNYSVITGGTIMTF